MPKRRQQDRLTESIKRILQDAGVGNGRVLVGGTRGGNNRVGGRAPDWNCSNCHYYNFGRNNQCARCKDAPGSPTTRVKPGYDSAEEKKFANLLRQRTKREHDGGHWTWWTDDEDDEAAGWWQVSDNGKWTKYDEHHKQERESKGAAESTKLQDARIEELKIIYEGRCRILQRIRAAGGSWGDATYDAAWYEREKARQEYVNEKPPMARSKKIELLHGDVAKAEGALDRAKEDVEEARKRLQLAEEKQKKAEERVQKQRSRLAEYTGEEGIALDGGRRDVVTEMLQPFAHHTRTTLDECGSELQQLQAWVDGSSGEQMDVIGQSVNFLLAKVSTIRDQAFQIESTDPEQYNLADGDDADEFDDIEDVEGARDEAINDPQHHHGERMHHGGKVWQAQPQHSENAVYWNNQYWCEIDDQAVENGTVDRRKEVGRQAEQEPSASVTAIAPVSKAAEKSGANNAVPSQPSSSKEDEPMPAAIGPNDPNKKQKCADK